MNPIAAQELLNVIMQDDFVTRRQMLDDWTRRWVMTAEVEGPDKVQICARLMLEIVKGEQPAAVWSQENGVHKLRMHVVRQEPYEQRVGE